jgi:hypothetical protein
MNTPREPNVRTWPAQALDQARGWPRQPGAPNVQRPILTLYPKTLRPDHPVSPAQLSERTGESKPMT